MARPSFKKHTPPWRVLLGTFVAISCASLGYGLPAFPGAAGFGSTTPGGRGGRIVRVTTLADSGPGSFREAVTATASNPADKRIVIFDVAGEILLQSQIIINNSCMTIAGQTAPGGGITLRINPTNSTLQKLVRISASQVIIRYLRFRPGTASTSPPLANGQDPGNLDALDVGDDGAGSNHSHIVIDHCSFSWATDEILNTSAHDVTLSWNIIAEGLDHSTHPLGRHSKGLHLLGESDTDSDNLSVHHNLLAHNLERNPNINTSGIVDLVNNVFYNAITWTEIKNKWSLAQVNVVGNFYKKGPDYVVGAGTFKQSLNGWEVIFSRDADGATNRPEAYLQGNIGWHRLNATDSENLIVRTKAVYPFEAEDDYLVLRSTRFPAPALPETSAVVAYSEVLDRAGATWPARDAIDTRIVDSVCTGTGRIIDTPAQVGGWISFAPELPKLDTDGDGMPDEWESDSGLDPNNPADGNQDANGDGYTNVEEYLNGLDLFTLQSCVPVVAWQTASPSGGPLALTVSGKPGTSYVLESSTNLLNWTAVVTNTIPVTGPPMFTNSVSATSAFRSFRARASQ